MTTPGTTPEIEDVIGDAGCALQGYLVAFLRSTTDGDARAAQNAYQIMRLTLLAAGAMPVEQLPYVDGHLVGDVVDVLGMPHEDELARRMLAAADTHELSKLVPRLDAAAEAAGCVAEAAGFAAFILQTVRARLNLCPAWTDSEQSRQTGFALAAELSSRAWVDKRVALDLPTELYAAGTDWREPLAIAPAHGWHVAHVVRDTSEVHGATRRIWWRAWDGDTVEHLAQELRSGRWVAATGLSREKVYVGTPDTLSLLVGSWYDWITEPLPRPKSKPVGYFVTDESMGTAEILWYCDGQHWHLVARPGRRAPLFELSDNPGRWDTCPAGRPRRVN